MSYVIWDTETGIKTLHKRKASPFHPDNHIVASGFKKKGMALAVADYFGKNKPTGNWFTKLLDGSKLIVGFNIKFDLLHALRDPDNYKAWKRWIVDGGRLWDSQLAEYHIHGMAREHHMLSLDEVAPRYGGHLKNDAVKALWEAGVDTQDIDKDLLLEYLIGADGGDKDLGDIGNTELVFLGQVETLRRRGGLNSVILGMDAMIAVIECERNGMYVDKTEGLRLAAELEAKLKQITDELEQYIPADKPAELAFNWGSRFHLSALVFGGQVKYKAKAIILDDDGKPVYYQKKETHYVLTDGTTTADAPTGEDVLRYVTVASGKNKGEFKTKQVTVPDLARGPKDRYEDFYFQFPGFTEPSKAWESSTPGVYSVASEVIEALGNRDVPFLKTLATMAALSKDLGTYYITTDPDTGEQKGMLTLVGDDGIVHHSINQCSTVTARFSSSNPNLQNVSGSGKSQVKSVFRSRFPGGKIIQSDFTSLEIYIQALLTRCRQLIDDLKAGLDMHCVRLAQKMGKTYEEVYAAYKAGDKDIAKGRKGAKEFSFQRAYGAGVAAIAAATGMAESDIEELVLAEAERYPEVDEFYACLTQQIKMNRVPTNRFVQHPSVPGLQCQLGRSHYVTPDGKMYSYSESPSPEWIAKKPASQGGTPQSFSPPEIRNYVVQGGGAEWAKAALAISVRMFYFFDNFGGLALLVNQVHDAEYVDSHPSVAIKSAALLHASMEEASAYMEYKFQWEVPVPVPSETKYGDSMIDENDMPPEFKPQVLEYRKLIRDRLMPGFIPSYEKTQEKEHGTV